MFRVVASDGVKEETIYQVARRDQAEALLAAYREQLGQEMEFLGSDSVLSSLYRSARVVEGEIANPAKGEAAL